MKIQIDTENKTIAIEEDVLLHDFYEQINGLLPGGLWREFTLKVTKITEWKDPIVIDRPPLREEPQPHTQPWNPINPNFPWSPTITDPYGYPQIWYTTTTDNTGRPVVRGGDYNNDVKLNNGLFNVEFKA